LQLIFHKDLIGNKTENLESCDRLQCAWAFLKNTETTNKGFEGTLGKKMGLM